MTKILALEVMKQPQEKPLVKMKRFYQLLVREMIQFLKHITTKEILAQEKDITKANGQMKQAKCHQDKKITQDEIYNFLT